MGSNDTWNASLVIQERCDNASVATGCSDVERRRAPRQLRVMDPRQRHGVRGCA